MELKPQLLPRLPVAQHRLPGGLVVVQPVLVRVQLTSRIGKSEAARVLRLLLHLMAAPLRLPLQLELFGRVCSRMDEHA